VYQATYLITKTFLYAVKKNLWGIPNLTKKIVFSQPKSNFFARCAVDAKPISFPGYPEDGANRLFRLIRIKTDKAIGPLTNFDQLRTNSPNLASINLVVYHPRIGGKRAKNFP